MKYICDWMPSHAKILEMGLEPTISSLGGRRLIHYATRAVDLWIKLIKNKIYVFFCCLHLLYSQCSEHMMQIVQWDYDDDYISCNFRDNGCCCSAIRNRKSTLGFVIMAISIFLLMLIFEFAILAICILWNAYISKQLAFEFVHGAQ